MGLTLWQGPGDMITVLTGLFVNHFTANFYRNIWTTSTDCIEIEDKFCAAHNLRDPQAFSLSSRSDVKRTHRKGFLYSAASNNEIQLDGNGSLCA